MSRTHRLLFPQILGVLPLLFAMAAFAQGLRERPTVDPNLLNEEGVISTREGDYKRAVEAFHKAYIAEPTQEKLLYNYFTSLVNYSLHLARSGQASEAIETCSKAISLFPREIIVASNLAVFFNNEAVKHLDEGNVAAALESIENSQAVVKRFRLRQSAETVNRTHGRIHLFEGRDWFRKENVRNALDAYDRCLRINPREVEAYLDRSRIYWEQGAFRDAIADLEEGARILGEGRSASLESLIARIKLEAQAAGQPVGDQAEFFILEVRGGDEFLESKIKRLLRDTRLTIARTLQINPKTELHIAIDAQRPLVRASEWINRSAADFYGESFEMGVSGVDPEGRDFQEALTFNYVVTLLVNLGGRGVPYWFTVGLAHRMTSEESRLSIRDQESLVAAGENNLLLGMNRLTWTNIENMEDAQTLRQANLESISLVNHLVGILHDEGLATLLKALRDGLNFESALNDITNMTPEQIEEEWRNSL